MSTQRGFTLLELLVAFTVMAVLGVALMQVFSSSASNQVRVRAHQALIDQAQSLLARLQAKPSLQRSDLAGVGQDGTRWYLEPVKVDHTGSATSQRPQHVRLRLERADQGAELILHTILITRWPADV